MHEQTRASIGQAQQGQEEGSDAGGKSGSKKPTWGSEKKEMALTQEKLKELLNYDPETGVFKWKVSRGKAAVNKVAGCYDPEGYSQIKLVGFTYRAHRLAWFYHYGVWPDGEIDHKDHNPANNRISNLRDATGAQNLGNMIRAHRDSKSGILGVWFDNYNEVWLAKISVRKKIICIGQFRNKEDAKDAYLNAKRKLHEFCTI